MRFYLAKKLKHFSKVIQIVDAQNINPFFEKLPKKGGGRRERKNKLESSYIFQNVNFCHITYAI